MEKYQFDQKNSDSRSSQAVFCEVVPQFSTYSRDNADDFIFLKFLHNGAKVISNPRMCAIMYQNSNVQQ